MTFTLPDSGSYQRIPKDYPWRAPRVLPEGDHGDGGDAAAQAAAATQAAAAQAAAAKTAADAKAAADAKSDKGFPEGTPIAQMTAEQQANYWKHQSRQHEDRVKALGITPDQLKELQDKAARQDALEDELASEHDKALKNAKTTAEKNAQDKYVPALVRAEFRAAAAGKVAPDHLHDWIENNVGVLDLSKFLAADGSVDTAKVTAYVDSNTTPGKGTQRPAGPSASGQGFRPPGSATPGEQGRTQAEKRFGLKTPA